MFATSCKATDEASQMSELAGAKQKGEDKVRLLDTSIVSCSGNYTIHLLLQKQLLLYFKRTLRTPAITLDLTGIIVEPHTGTQEVESAKYPGALL